MSKDKERQFVVWDFRDCNNEEIRVILQQVYEQKVGVVFAHNINDAEKFTNIYPNISYIPHYYGLNHKTTVIFSSSGFS